MTKGASPSVWENILQILRNGNRSGQMISCKFLASSRTPDLFRTSDLFNKRKRSIGFIVSRTTLWCWCPQNICVHWTTSHVYCYKSKNRQSLEEQIHSLNIQKSVRPKILQIIFYFSIDQFKETISRYPKAIAPWRIRKIRIKKNDPTKCFHLFR